MRTLLDRLIPRQPAHPVYVLIGTGELGQAVCLHHRHDQGVIAEEPGLWLTAVPVAIRAIAESSAPGYGFGGFAQRLVEVQRVVGPGQDAAGVAARCRQRAS
jgi:hypothetical protein